MIRRIGRGDAKNKLPVVAIPIRRFGVRMLVIICELVWIVLVLTPSSKAQMQVLTPEDIVRRQSLNSFGLSPDGKQFGLIKNTNLWLIDLHSRTTQRITSSQVGEGVHYRNPKWSPDGRHIAMVSDQVGEGLGLTIWDHASNGVHPLLDRTLYQGRFAYSFFEWLNNNRILCAMLPPDDYGSEYASSAMHGWLTARIGRQPTASVLNSQAKLESGFSHHVQLVVIDVDKGVLSSYDAGFLAAASSSPDGQHVAILSEDDGGSMEENTDIAHFYKYRTTLLDIDSRGRILPHGSFGFSSQFHNEDHWAHWSSDSQNVIFSNMDMDKDYLVDDNPLKWFVCHLPRIQFEEVELKEFGGPIRDVGWTHDGHLLVYAPPRGELTVHKESAARDWWELYPHQSPRNLTLSCRERTEQLRSGGTTFISERQDGSFLTLTNGQLCRIDPNQEQSERMARNFDEPISRVLFPKIQQGEYSDQSKGNYLITAAETNASEKLYRFDLQSGKYLEVVKPTPDADLLAYSLLKDLAVFVRPDAAVWVCRSAGNDCRKVDEVTTFLSQRFRTTIERDIPVHSPDGRTLKADLMYPVNYEKGRLYPVITCVYAGSKCRLDDNPDDFDRFFDMQLFASHGYAVLAPEIPLGPEGIPGNPYVEMLKSVMPAVNEIIARRIGDPERVGLIGHSFGGYSVLSIITQTSRFRAAIAMASVSDLISEYGAFGYPRYGTNFNLAGIPWSETGQGRMGNPPWQDLAHYTRNSPLFEVGRIETPVMLVHGDQDTAVPIEQSEEMFSALVREHKHAEFVRYWGEGHLITNPQNLKDLWQRMYLWFDELLAPRTQNGTTAQQ